MSIESSLTAREAAALLDISTATLYAYVSRGLLRSVDDDPGRRTKLYNREDVERLRERQALKRSPRDTVENALNWGVPMIPSGITLIQDGQLYYRGRNAVDLARTRLFEEAASLLWTNEIDGVPFREARSMPARCQTLLAQLGDTHPTMAMQIILATIAGDDASSFDIRPAAALRTAATVQQAMFQSVIGRDFDGDLVPALASHWKVAKAAPLLNAALILCADHELNISSFSARCAASAGSGLPHCVSAGLNALMGPKHGGAAESALAMLREVGTAPRAKDVLSARLRRGEAIPGFGHRLYPAGDPRGRHLVDLARANVADFELVDAVERAALEIIGERPTVDYGLAAISHGLALPPHAPLALFALGRTAGWIAHTLEEYARDTLIRPRAKYVGLAPAI